MTPIWVAIITVAGTSLGTWIGHHWANRQQVQTLDRTAELAREARASGSVRRSEDQKLALAGQRAERLRVATSDYLGAFSDYHMGVARFSAELESSGESARTAAAGENLQSAIKELELCGTRLQMAGTPELMVEVIGNVWNAANFVGVVMQDGAMDGLKAVNLEKQGLTMLAWKQIKAFEEGGDIPMTVPPKGV